MIRRIFLAVVFVCAVFSVNATAATVTYEFTQNNHLIFNINFDRGYSGVEAIRGEEGVIVSFDTTESLIFERQDFFDSVVKSAWLVTEGTRKRLHFDFNGSIVEPVISTYSAYMQIDFLLPVWNSQQDASLSPAVPGTGAYVRMIFGLVVIVVVIIGAYFLMRRFFKTSIVTDIPGIGRMLGKVDIEVKKSIVFYELGEIIYVLGVTDGGISLIDKITDTVDINLVKSGFSRRKEFSSYLKFFNKDKGDIKNDIKDSSDLIEEKLTSLRKK